MTADQLRALQAPLKDRYRTDPASARVTLKRQSELGPDVTARVKTTIGVVNAGLHPATGGDGSKACSADMLLEALAACAGVTMNAVATAIGIDIRSGVVKAEGDVDFRGTLGVDKDARVGFEAIRLRFQLDTDAPEDQLAKLVKLTERYCVVFQTLRVAPTFTVEYSKSRT